MNPLLQKFETPFEVVPFDKIKEEHYIPALQEAIKQAKEKIEQIKQNSDEETFENVLEALENSGDLIDTISLTFFNLHSAESNDTLQKLAKEISPMLKAFENDVILDEQLFSKIKKVYEKRNELNLTVEQSTLLEKSYKRFVRNGANLNEDDKQKLRELDAQLAKLSLEFGDHLLAVTNSYFMEITDQKDLQGLPDGVIEAAAMTAKEKEKEGSYLFTLQYPSYIPFMQNAENRELREKLARAFSTRCYQDDENDNRQIVKEIIRLRHERANLLGYENHSQFILEERMAASPDKVFLFLDDLINKSKPMALKELEEMTAYAKSIGGPDMLQAWDAAFYGEKLKKEKFNIDDEILKPYFQLEKVRDGAFKVARQLYGLNFLPLENVPVYHEDVNVYEVQNEKGEHLGVFYCDFFPRAGKRGGAWMTAYRGQQKIAGIDKRPHIAIVCNFTRPTESKPSLLSFNEVRTLFHEFGHALHGLVSDCTYGSLSSPQVYWDFVELPSQIMENWIYEKECLDLFAVHYETGEKIPLELIKKIKESASFQEGLATVRQLNFGLLDMRWHTTNPTDIDDVGEFESSMTERTRVFPKVEGVNTSCAFGHIFQGGYSSGYYSYKWAEVLDADAFELFKEKGIFNREVAESFRNNILARGGTEHPMDLYVRFRGKEPTVDALLKRSGLISEK